MQSGLKARKSFRNASLWRVLSSGTPGIGASSPRTEGAASRRYRRRRGCKVGAVLSGRAPRCGSIASNLISLRLAEADACARSVKSLGRAACPSWADRHQLRYLHVVLARPYLQGLGSELHQRQGHHYRFQLGPTRAAIIPRRGTECRRLPMKATGANYREKAV